MIIYCDPIMNRNHKKHTGVNSIAGEYYSVPSQFVYSSSPETDHAAAGVFLDNDSVVISFSRA